MEYRGYLPAVVTKEDKISGVPTHGEGVRWAIFTCEFAL